MVQEDDSLEKAAMGRNKRTVEDRRRAIEHLNYEVEMFKVIAHAIDSGIANRSVIGNALLESFALHTRNIIDFLWSERPKNDHIIAEDYFDDPNHWKISRPPLTDNLKTARRRVHKEIAHISYERIKRNKHSRSWNISLIVDDIMIGIKAFEKESDFKLTNDIGVNYEN